MITNSKDMEIYNVRRLKPGRRETLEKISGFRSSNFRNSDEAKHRNAVVYFRPWDR